MEKTGKTIICAICGKEKYYSGCCFKRAHPPKYCSMKCKKLGMIGNEAWNKGKNWSDEVKEKISCAKSGKNHQNWGKQLSQETRKKISRNNIGKHFDRIGKTYEELYGNQADAIKEKIRRGNKNKQVSQEIREKIRKSLTGRKHSPAWFEKMCGRKLTKEHIKKALRRRIPTSLEEKFLNIVYKHNLPYAYVGNGTFLIDRYNPDFINIDGKNIAVEVYARLFKTIDGRSVARWKENREKVFHKYGWQIIFFDETELTEDNVLLALQ